MSTSEDATPAHGSFGKLFKVQAGAYALYRPRYPSELYDQLFKQVEGRDLAVDVATGNGQAAEELAKEFAKVIAIDSEESQIEQAPSIGNVTFRISTAEDLSFCDDSTVDVLTVAQALHWFDLDKFYAEAQRVLKTGGILASWGYELNHFDNEKAQELLMELYDGTLGSYWSARRKLVESKYVGMEPKFGETSRSVVYMTKDMPVTDYVRYLSTWSSYNSFKQAHGGDDQGILDKFQERLCQALGVKPEDDIAINHPIFLIVTKKTA